MHDRWLGRARGRFGVLMILVVTNFVVLMLQPSDKSAVLTGTLVVFGTALFALDSAYESRPSSLEDRSD
jgi:hypothetical protein